MVGVVKGKCRGNNNRRTCGCGANVLAELAFKRAEAVVLEKLLQATHREATRC